MDHLESTACPFLEGHRTDVTKVTVSTSAVVETFNVFEHIRSGFFTISVTYSVDTFTFEYAKKALNNRIIITVASPTHTALDTLVVEQLTIVIACVLTASIGMMDECTLRLSSSDRHRECINRQVSVYPPTHRPANDFS
jgi:hypothetical protein